MIESSIPIQCTQEQLAQRWTDLYPLIARRIAWLLKGRVPRGEFQDARAECVGLAWKHAVGDWRIKGLFLPHPLHCAFQAYVGWIRGDRVAGPGQGTRGKANDVYTVLAQALVGENDKPRSGMLLRPEFLVCWKEFLICLSPRLVVAADLLARGYTLEETAYRAHCTFAAVQARRRRLRMAWARYCGGCSGTTFQTNQGRRNWESPEALPTRTDWLALGGITE